MAFLIPDLITDCRRQAKKESRVEMKSTHAYPYSAHLHPLKYAMPKIRRSPVNSFLLVLATISLRATSGEGTPDGGLIHQPLSHCRDMDRREAHRLECVRRTLGMLPCDRIATQEGHHGRCQRIDTNCQPLRFQ